MQVADNTSEIAQVGFEFFPTGIESGELSEYNGCGFRLISSGMSFIDKDCDGNLDTAQGLGNVIYITMNTDRGRIIDGAYICNGDNSNNRCTIKAVLNSDCINDPASINATEYNSTSGTMQIKSTNNTYEISIDCVATKHNDKAHPKTIKVHYKGKLTPVAII